MKSGTRPRLILLTQWFDPEPVMKGHSFALRLRDLGFDVEVVTGFPNYPGGEIYDGYRIRSFHREKRDGITITRLPLYPSHDSKKIGRILNYVSFFVSTLLYLMVFARRADVMYAYHPPLTVGMSAAIARFFRRTPTVLDVQDMWPDTLRATGMITNERALKVVGVFCRWTWRNADHIAVISNGFRKLLLARGVPDEKITVIPNWSNEEGVSALSPPRPKAFDDPGKFRILFAGNMGAAQALDSVLDAAGIVLPLRPEIDFCFLGAGIETDRLKARATEQELTNVTFLPRVSSADVGGYLLAADCLLVHLKADPLFAITIPSKTQAYMAAGKPVVMAVEGDAADIIEQSSGGVVVPPENPQALADAVIRLASLPMEELAELGANAGRYYEEELAFKKGTSSFATVFHDVIRNRGSK